MQITFWQVMLFYAFLSCFVAPFVGHYFMPSIVGYERGYIGGTALSMILWFSVGRKMVR